MMRKISIALCAALVLGFTTSCSDDDSKGGSNDLLGKWNNSRMEVFLEGEEEPIFNEVYPHNASCSKDYIELLADDVYREVKHVGNQCQEDVYEATWTKDGNSVTIDTEDDGPTTGTVERKGSELIFRVTGEQEGMTITAVSYYTKR